MRSKRGQGSEELDLVPIMNLVTILIPFLLFSASFVTLGVVDTTLPAINQETPPDPDPEERLDLSILIGTDGYGLVAKQDLGMGDDVKIPCVGGCATAESWDTARLTELLVTIKDRYPDEQDVILVPDSRVEYDVLIRTMDAARADGTRELFPGVVVAGGV